VHRFEFPGYVPPSELKFETLEPVDRKTLHHPSRGTLNELYATAICGNDLTSSVLYVIGVTTTLSGQLAPICLISVGLVLYLFKSVYGEVKLTPIPPSLPLPYTPSLAVPPPNSPLSIFLPVCICLCLLMRGEYWAETGGNGNPT
jgi:hypothetical protein